MQIKKNITPLLNYVLQKLIKHSQFIAMQVDKNMVVCILKQEDFINWVLNNHLGNTETHKQLTFAEASVKSSEIHYLYHDFISRHREVLGEAVITFMNKAIENMGTRSPNSEQLWKYTNHPENFIQWYPNVVQFSNVYPSG